MKLRLLAKLGELILGQTMADGEHRADMYMPVKVLAASLVLIIFGIWFVAVSIIKFSALSVIMAVIFIVFGVISMLLWRNQSIMIISEDKFVYRTVFGNEKVYRFDQIRGFIRHRDSGTLYVGTEKIHMERSAVLTKRLSSKINERLVKIAETEK